MHVALPLLAIATVPAVDLFGAGVASAGDFDGDGAGDLIVHEGWWHDTVMSHRSFIVSGATGDLLLAIPDLLDDRLATLRFIAPDVDGDGAPELVVGVRTPSKYREPGDVGVEVRGGHGLELVSRWAREYDGVTSLRVSVAPTLVDGRLDVIEMRTHDARHRFTTRWSLTFPDLEVRNTSPIDRVPESVREWLRLGRPGPDGTAPLLVAHSNDRRSGLRGLSLLHGPDDWRHSLGRLNSPCLALVSDVDGDGLDDCLVTSRVVRGFRMDRALFAMRIVSTGSGRVLAARDRRYFSVDGGGVERVGDLDGDGYEDLLVLDHHFVAFQQEPRWIDVLSGRDLSRFRRLIEPEVTPLGYNHFGISGCGVADLDGDDVPDLAVASMSYWNSSQPGTVDLFSGASGEFIRRISRASLGLEEAGTGGR